MKRKCHKKNSYIVILGGDERLLNATFVPSHLVCLQTATGDTIVSSKSSALAAARRAEREGEKKHRQNNEAERVLLAGVEIPEPVFFCTIEPPSVSKQPGINGPSVSTN